MIHTKNYIFKNWRQSKYAISLGARKNQVTDFTQTYYTCNFKIKNLPFSNPDV